MHLNPNVREPVNRILGDVENVLLLFYVLEQQIEREQFSAEVEERYYPRHWLTAKACVSQVRQAPFH